jgi:hypothetical protein
MIKLIPIMAFIAPLFVFWYGGINMFERGPDQAGVLCISIWALIFSANFTWIKQ